MINVRYTDHQTERKILSIVENNIYFHNLEFRQNPELTAIFDFDGIRYGEIALRMDIKALNEPSSKYPHSIFSIDKLELFESERDRRDHYVVIGYRGDRNIFVYKLQDIRFIKTGKIHFTHRRTGEDREDTVCFVRKSDALRVINV